MALKAKKMNRLALVAAVLALFVFGSARAAEETVEEILKRPPVAPLSTNRDLDLNRRVVTMLCQFHYTPGQVDAKRSSMWFNEYFRSLDYTRMYFLDSDIEEFRSYETVLGDTTNLKRRVDFAFKVYERLLQRVQQWAVYSVAAVNMPHDFTQSVIGYAVAAVIIVVLAVIFARAMKFKSQFKQDQQLVGIDLAIKKDK